jgi:hypothetical protein
MLVSSRSRSPNPIYFTPPSCMITLRHCPPSPPPSELHRRSLFVLLLSCKIATSGVLSDICSCWRVPCFISTQKDIPNNPRVGTMFKFLKESVMIIGNLQSIVYTPPNSQYVGGLILLTRPHHKPLNISVIVYI